MQVNDWRRIEELFHATLQLGGAEDRAAYLARECAGDESLRGEVESLVAASESEHSFIEQPALSLGLRVLSDGLSGSLVGRSIGHYKVVRLLGRGGMGEVYLAEDSVLERPVALKFIANNFTGDEWAQEQLMKEARAVARLENSNICAVFGVEETESHHFIVMQYCEGETLASLLRREGSVGVGCALALAEQIAAALAAAHARGVIHRDVKPQNIIVAADEQVKVLDFGLAKFVRPPPQGAQSAGGAASQTTQFGAVIGTVAYMSPEQTRGEELDCRSDIFSFGIVLYEMLGGRNPFLRETDEQTISAIKSDDAPPLPSGLPPGPHAGLERIARKCLAKERELRYETAEELLRDLRDIRSGGERDARRSVHLKRYAAAALALFILLLAGAGFVYRKLSTVHTLAVLPITNQSRDPAADYLSVGLTRTLTDKFSYLPRLKLKLPSVVPPGKSEPADLAGIGRDLQADAVLFGRILKEGESLRLRLSLLRASDAARLWERTFDLGAADVLSFQDGIAREVADSLGMWLVGDEDELLSKRQTKSHEALNLYMHGRHHWGLKRDRQNIQTAINYFERAVNADPSFAKAYTGLADSYVLMTNVLYGPLKTSEAMDKARWAARQALELDGSLPEAHTSMGVIKFYEWDWQEAEREFKRAIELDSGYPPAHFWYSNLLAVQGRSPESIRESEAAKGLDPYSPLAQMNYGRAFYYARRHDEAAAEFRRLLEQRPDYPQFLHISGLVLLARGEHREAIATLEKLYSINRDLSAAALGHAYGKAGRPDDALRIIREIDERSGKEQHVPPIEKALVYIGMGDRDAAFALLEESYRQQLPILGYLMTDPLYDDLRPDPRFADLARRVNLKP